MCCGSDPYRTEGASAGSARAWREATPPALARWRSSRPGLRSRRGCSSPDRAARRCSRLAATLPANVSPTRSGPALPPTGHPSRWCARCTAACRETGPRSLASMIGKSGTAAKTSRAGSIPVLLRLPAQAGGALVVRGQQPQHAALQRSKSRIQTQRCRPWIF